jgi:hypothetical protein
MAEETSTSMPMQEVRQFNLIRIMILSKTIHSTKVSSSYYLCVECFSQISFDSEVYTKSATAADFVYTSESNESCEKHSTQR